MRHAWLVLVLVGCASRAACPAGELAAPARAPAFLLLRSDRTSSALALLDADGAPIVTDWLDSGTRVSTLVTSLAGDPALPSSPLGTGAIAWIDRSPVDVLSVWVGDEVAQVDLRAEAPGARTGFSANPYDALALTDGRVLVSRFGVNPDGSAGPLQRGNDVVVVEHGAVTRSIGLGADGLIDPCTGECTAYAHPGPLVPLGPRTVLVVLDRFDRRFERAGDGGVLGIDRETLIPSAAVSLAPLQNCRAASVDPDDPARAYVLCAGSFMLTPEGRRPSAGIAEITVDAAGSITVAARWQAPDGVPVVGTGLIALGGGRVLAVANEGTVASADPPDHLLEVDVVAGTVRDVYASRGGFVLGDGALAGDVALIPDAERGGVMRVEVSGPAVARELIVIDDCAGLPPRQLRPLRF